MKVSVITCSLTRRDLMLRLLNNLAVQTRLPNEIILIEAGDAKWGIEDAPVILRDRLIILYAPGESLAASRYRGKANAKGDALFFLDDDIILPATYISDAVSYLEENKAIMGVGGIYVDESTQKRSNLSLTIGRLFGIYSSGKSNKILKSGWADYVRAPYSGSITSAQWLFGCNFFIRAKVLNHSEEIFPVQMSAWSFLEDVFIGAQLTKAYGECLHILPSLAVTHAPNTSAGKINKATLRMRILYRYLFWRDFLGGITRKSRISFFLGMFANLLLMLKQERKLWVISASIETYLYMFNKSDMGWEEVNEFIFS